jgi:hypothetical protein
MKIRVFALIMLLGVYVGAPLLTPARHTALAQTYSCFCDHVGEKYTYGGGGIYVGTDYNDDVQIGNQPTIAHCTAACWNDAYQWAQWALCPQEPDQNMWYIRTTTYSWGGAPGGGSGQIGPDNIPCPWA